MDEIFTAVRDACTPATWSKGVELSRAGRVTRERADEDEIVLRVDLPSGMFCPRVVLFLDDNEWDCDCRSHADPCEHVAAAVIAVAKGDEATPGTGIAPGRIVYRLARRGGGIWFERGVEVGGEFEAIEATLDAVASGRAPGPRFMATRHDLNVEVALGTRKRGLIEKPFAAKLFSALQHCSDVRLDGEPVNVSPRELLPVVVVEDQGEGFRLYLSDDPGVTERFREGLALCGKTIRPVGAPALTGRERHDLGQGRSFGVGAVAELVGEILPSLEKRVPLDVRTRRLPEVVREKPRVVLESKRDGTRLTALARLVYGDPPVARIEGGRLVALGDGRVPLRDEDAERRLLRRLGRELGLAPGIPENLEAEAAVAFAEKLKGWSDDVEGDDHRWFHRAPALVPRLKVAGDDFELSFDVEGQEGDAGRGARRGPAPDDVVRAWRSGASLVPLPDGGWSPLPADWLGRFGHRIADLLAARDAGGTLPACVVPDLARLCEELDEPPPPAFERLRVLLDDHASIPEAGLPADLAADLRPYQRLGVNWLIFLRQAGMGALLADDMGLGKTVQALCALGGRSLVVAPTSVVHNWRDEANRFRPGLRLCIYHGPDRKLDPEADLTLTSYALLRLDREPLTGVRWDTVVLDEAQAIKNPASQVAQAAYALDGAFRVSMSGTPVENRLDELWSQFHFVNRGLLGGLSDFQERYARPVADGDAEAAALLRRRVRPFLLRRLKKEVAPELPPRTDVVLRCALSETEREVYDAVRATTVAEVVRKLREGGGVLAALEALLRLRQAACHPALVPGQEAETSAKTEMLLGALENVAADGHRALVFSQWTSMLDLLEPHLRRAGIPFLRLDGSTRDREGVVGGFLAADGPPVLLISLRAGGTGLNLTAADHVFLVDPWWNPAVEDQAADRTHRIGQDRPVLVYRLVAEETVEERILALQERKRELAEIATGSGAGALDLSRDDLLDLLE